MDQSNEIRKANRKALPKFILLMVISLLIGGGVGFFSAKYGLNALAGGMKSAGLFFGMNIAPWLMLAAAILMPAVCIPIYRHVKRLLREWDGENEEISDLIDGKLSVVIWLTSTLLILSFFLIAASYSGGFAIFENGNHTVPFFISVAAFFSVLVEVIIIQQKCVDAAKETNPEKTASVYDMKFQKKWMDSCDEAEKILIGKCAFKAYTATNMICGVLSIILAVCALTFDIGFIPSLAVCLIWIVNQSVYCKETLKFSKAGNKFF